MDRKRISIVLLTVAIAGISLVAILTWNAKRSLYTGGGFKRKFVSVTPLTETHSMELDNSMYYFAGKSTSNVYLAHKFSALDVLSLDLSLSKKEWIKIKLNAPDTLKFRSLQVRIDSTSFYVGDGVVPFYFRGNLGDGIGVRVDIERNYFMDFLPLGNDKILFKSLWNSDEVRVGIYDVATKMDFFYAHILEKQFDGIFCTDGTMQIEGSTIVYVYFYRNEFLTIKLNGNNLVKKSHHTIDTTSIVKVKTSDFKEGSHRTYKGSPPHVNRKSAVDSGMLYVQSALQSDNDSEGAFETNVVVDVYDLATGEYQYSFYIPKVDGDAFEHFTITGRTVMAMFGRVIKTYKLI